MVFTECIFCSYRELQAFGKVIIVLLRGRLAALDKQIHGVKLVQVTVGWADKNCPAIL